MCSEPVYEMRDRPVVSDELDPCWLENMGKQEPFLHLQGLDLQKEACDSYCCMRKQEPFLHVKGLVYITTRKHLVHIAVQFLGGGNAPAAGRRSGACRWRCCRAPDASCRPCRLPLGTWPASSRQLPGCSRQLPPQARCSEQRSQPSSRPSAPTRFSQICHGLHRPVMIADAKTTKARHGSSTDAH